jgi:hypothetical protein
MIGYQTRPAQGLRSGSKLTRVEVIVDVLNGISLLLSLIAVVVSIWAAKKANDIAGNELRLSRRVDLHNMLFEIDREALNNPELLAIFKSSKMKPSDEPMKIAQYDRYIYLFFNLFELSHSQFKVLRELTSEEQEISRAWDKTIAWFFDDCRRATVVWENIRENTYVTFRSYIDEIVAGTKKETDATDAAP